MSNIAFGTHLQGNTSVNVMPPHHNLSQSSFQDTRTPDINLERDLVADDIALGAALTELESGEKFFVNIKTIIISAIIFLLILAWFDTIQTAFYYWLDPEGSSDLIDPQIKFYYAIFITIFGLSLILLIFYYSIKSKSK